MRQELYRPHANVNPDTEAPLHVETNVFDPEEHDKRRRKTLRAVLAAGVAAAAIGGAGAVALGGKGENVEAKQPPVATAPAVPGSQAPTAHETTPSTAPSNVEVPASAWTKENVPLVIDIDGNGAPETYVGVDKLAGALELSVDKYPTPEAASKALPGLVTEWVNWGNDPASREKYLEYNSPDGEWAGVAAVANVFVNRAFGEAITASPEEGAVVRSPATEWTSVIVDIHNQTAPRYSRTRDNASPYKVTFSLDSTKAEGGVVINSGVEAQDLHHGSIFVDYKDNFNESGMGNTGPTADGSVATPLEGSLVWHVDWQKQGDVWKLVGVETEANQASS